VLHSLAEFYVVPYETLMEKAADTCCPPRTEAGAADDAISALDGSDLAGRHIERKKAEKAGSSASSLLGDSTQRPVNGSSIASDDDSSGYGLMNSKSSTRSRPARGRSSGSAPREGKRWVEILARYAVIRSSRRKPAPRTLDRQELGHPQDLRPASALWWRASLKRRTASASSRSISARTPPVYPCAVKSETASAATLSLVLGTSLSLLPIARIASPAVSRVTDVSVLWHLEGLARAASLLEASLAVPVASGRVEVTVRRHLDRDA
jgi:hypothetical protein